jgi:sodium/proline symporter
VISEDFYKVFVRPEATEKELLIVSRSAVLIIALLALLIASDRESRVLDLVSYAWAGFGASFGPVIVFSLFWRKMTALSAIAGMIVGAVTVIIWSNLSGGLFDLYEIAPGFLLASLTIVAFSLLRPETSPQVAASFEEVELMLKE